MGQMKLFYAPDSSSLLPHIVFHEAGLPFEAVKIDEQTKVISGGGDFKRVNPLGYVPALVLNDGTLLTEGRAVRATTSICFRYFIASSAPPIETPWSVATLDFVFPSTRGQRPADFETTLSFSIALTRLAAEDPAIHKLTAEVQNLLKPRSVYRDPALLQRVFTMMAQA
jgi:hypothetical protein